MSSRDKQSQGQMRPGFDWPAIIRTLSVEIVVLLALATAYVGYLNWSSEVNVREFMAASQSAAAEKCPLPMKGTGGREADKGDGWFDCSTRCRAPAAAISGAFAWA